MNVERLQLKGMLAELKKRESRLDSEISGRMMLIRTILNPYAEDVTKLDTESGLNEMTALHKAANELREIRAKIARLESDLE